MEATVLGSCGGSDVCKVDAFLDMAANYVVRLVVQQASAVFSTVLDAALNVFSNGGDAAKAEVADGSATDGTATDCVGMADVGGRNHQQLRTAMDRARKACLDSRGVPAIFGDGMLPTSVVEKVLSPVWEDTQEAIVATGTVVDLVIQQSPAVEVTDKVVAICSFLAKPAQCIVAWRRWSAFLPTRTEALQRLLEGATLTHCRRRLSVSWYP